jgi:hypothetical protein
VIERVAFPKWQEAFEYGKGTKTVAGTLHMVYSGGGVVSVRTDTVPLTCKGQEFNVHVAYRRNADGSFDEKDGVSLFRRNDYGQPTPAVRALLLDAVRVFVAAHWSDDMDAAGDLARASEDYHFAVADMEEHQRALVAATDRRDAAIGDYQKALARVPVGLRSGHNVRA